MDKKTEVNVISLTLPPRSIVTMGKRLAVMKNIRVVKLRAKDLFSKSSCFL